MKTDLQLFQNTKLRLPPIPKNCFELFQSQDALLLILADQNRYIHIYQYTSSHQLKSTYKSQPHQSSIASITISDDLIFFNTGAQIRAVNKKGKQVFKYDTCLAESIQKIIVSGYKLFVVGGTILNEFSMADAKLSNNKSRRIAPNNKNTMDVGMFVSQDDIIDVVLYKDVVKEYCVVLRSNNQIQIVDQDKSITSYKTEGIPLCVSHFDVDKSEYIIGLSTGAVICLAVQSKSNNLSFKQLWKIDSNDRKVTGVIRFHKGLIMCRSNQLQIWLPDQQSQYERIWKKTLAQPATNFRYILLSDEIIYTSINGQVVALSNYQKEIKQNKSKAEETKLSNLKIEKEIQILMEQKNKLLGKRQIVAKYKIKHTLLLNQVKRCWVLDVSCSLPINNVVFDGFNGVKCVYKQEFKSKDEEINQSQVFSVNNLNQLQFDIFAEEGVEKSGQIFISFNSQPAQATSIPIQLKPLSLYYKISNSIPPTVSTWHKLTITGAFTLSQANIWLLSIFNETVKQIPQTELKIVYESIITKQNIAVQVVNKKLEVSSQSVNPLIVVKKYIQLRAKQKQVSITVDISPSQVALENSLKNLEPQFLKFQKLHKEYKILSELIQLQKQVQQLNPNFKEIIKRKYEINKEYSDSIGVYDSLKESLMRMFVNYKGLRNEKPSDFQVENFKKKLGAFEVNEIKKMIL